MDALMKPVSRLANPVEWNGMKFRSKLESLVARELLKLKIQSVHELEGFGDGETLYLPDFFLPQQDCLLEVKPREFLSEVESKRRLIERIGKQYVVVDYAYPKRIGPVAYVRIRSAIATLTLSRIIRVGLFTGQISATKATLTLYNATVAPGIHAHSFSSDRVAVCCKNTVRTAAAGPRDMDLRFD
jgi:hypothetical protein